MKIFFCLVLLSLSQIILSVEVLSIENIMDIAIRHNSEIKRMELELENNRSLYEIKKIELLPQLTFSTTPFSFSQSLDFDVEESKWYKIKNINSNVNISLSQIIQQTGGSFTMNNRFGWQNSFNLSKDVNDQSFNNGLTFMYSQPISGHNEIRLNQKENKLNLDKSTILYNLKKLEFEKRINELFYQVYKSQSALNLAVENFNNNYSNYNMIMKKVEIGEFEKTTLFQANINLNISRHNKAEQEIEYKCAKEELIVMLGVNIDTSIMVQINSNIKNIVLNNDAIIEMALKNRQELLLKQIDIEESLFSLVRTKSSSGISGNMSFSYGVSDYDEKFSNLYSTSVRTPNVSLSLNIPMYDFGKKKLEKKRINSEVRISQLLLEEEKATITHSIVDLLRKIELLKQDIVFQQETIDNAKTMLDYYSEKYRIGEISGLELQLNQTQYYQVQMSYVNMLIDYKIGLLNLKIQALYDFEKGESIIL